MSRKDHSDVMSLDCGIPSVRMHRHQPIDILDSGASVLVDEHPISSSAPLPSTMSTSGSMRRRGRFAWRWVSPRAS